MGMYTELHLNSALRKGHDLPAGVLHVLGCMVTGDAPSRPLPDHPLFMTRRWWCMLTCDSAYFDAVAPAVRGVRANVPARARRPGSGSRRGADVSTSTSPHNFRPLRPWDLLHGRGRCRHCYAPRWAHPMHGWVKARPLGDRTYQPLSFESLGIGEEQT